MKASQGTGWCISGRGKAESYLGDKNDPGNKAKFIMFHLQDDQNRTSETACASIRLNSNGKVAEISGLGEGQQVEDSLIAIVENQTKELPGGEAYLPKIKDKNKLMAMDRKYRNREPFTLEELEFLFETKRRINHLNRHSKDTRIQQFKDYRQFTHRSILEEKYNQADLNMLFSAYEYDDNDGYNYDWQEAVNNGCSLDIIVNHMKTKTVVKELPQLLEAGAHIQIDNLLNNLKITEIAYNLPTLLEAGANIDVDELVSELYPYHIANNLINLLDAGANIDVDELVSELEFQDMVRNINQLMRAGANIDVDELVDEAYDEYGSEYDDNYYSTSYILKFLEAGVDHNHLMSKLGNIDIISNLNELLEAGASIDIDVLVSNLESYEIANNLNTLLEAGVDIDVLVSNLESYQIAENFNTLLEAGANIDILADILPPKGFRYASTIMKLLEKGVEIDLNNALFYQDFSIDISVQQTVELASRINNPNTLLEIMSTEFNQKDYILAKEALNKGLDSKTILNKIRYYSSDRMQFIEDNRDALLAIGISEGDIEDYLEQPNTTPPSIHGRRKHRRLLPRVPRQERAPRQEEG